MGDSVLVVCPVDGNAADLERQGPICPVCGTQLPIPTDLVELEVVVKDEVE